jgi:membrane-associated phospholipid phosphatase
MRWRVFFLCHLLAVLLAVTLFWPVTAAYWRTLDVSFFQCINGTLEGRPLWQTFWALANHKWADWVEDGVVLCFFLSYIYSRPKGLRLRAAADLLLLVLYIAAIIYFVNAKLFRECIQIHRESPTLVVDSSIRLSQEVTWMHIKEGSNKSFPGDHGTTALLFAAAFSTIAGWQRGIAACLYGAFLCLPRLIAGAHWLSDILVGSGAITLVFLSWFFCTPCFRWCGSRLERALALLKGRSCIPEE